MKQQLRNEFGQRLETQPVIYVLYDRTTGEVYKVGKTSVGPLAQNLNERFVNEFARGGSTLATMGINVDLAVDFVILKPSSLQSASAQSFETAVRESYENQGHKMYWDNSKITKNETRLGFSGSGLPWLNPQALANWLANRL